MTGVAEYIANHPNMATVLRRCGWDFNVVNACNADRIAHGCTSIYHLREELVSLITQMHDDNLSTDDIVKCLRVEPALVNDIVEYYQRIEKGGMNNE